MENKDIIKDQEPKEDQKPALEEEKPAESEVVSSVADEVGIIAKNTRVDGDITSSGNMAIYGEVLGDIDVLGDVIVTGKVDGTIKCANLRLDGCRIKANLSVKKAVTIDNGASVDGQIDCTNLSVNGNIKGNITAGGELMIYKEASVIGDIKAKSLGVEPGSKLCGNISIVK